MTNKDCSSIVKLPRASVAQYTNNNVKKIKCETVEHNGNASERKRCLTGLVDQREV